MKKYIEFMELVDKTFKGLTINEGKIFIDVKKFEIYTNAPCSMVNKILDVILAIESVSTFNRQFIDMLTRVADFAVTHCVSEANMKLRIEVVKLIHADEDAFNFLIIPDENNKDIQIPISVE